LSTENNDKDKTDAEKVKWEPARRVESKKPESAGRYHEVLADMIQHKTTLEGCAMKLNKLAGKYPEGDDQKSIIHLVESVSLVADKAFTELYNLYRSNATLKLQVEALK
jgi:hypothetical protein